MFVRCDTGDESQRRFGPHLMSVTGIGRADRLNYARFAVNLVIMDPPKTDTCRIGSPRMARLVV